jgi:hypothetical protein
LQTFWLLVHVGPASASLPPSVAEPPVPAPPTLPDDVVAVAPVPLAPEPEMWALPPAPQPVHPAKVAAMARIRKEIAGVPEFWRLRKASSSKFGGIRDTERNRGASILS